MLDEGNDAHLSGACLEMKHALTGEESTNNQAVDTPDQTSGFIPGFHRMGETDVVELPEQLLDVVRNPGFVACSARFDDRTEGHIRGESELGFLQGSAQRTRNAVAVPGDDCALRWPDPEDLPLSIVRHREASLHVGTKHPGRADRDSIFVSNSLYRAHQDLLQVGLYRIVDHSSRFACATDGQYDSSIVIGSQKIVGTDAHTWQRHTGKEECSG